MKEILRVIGVCEFVKEIVFVVCLWYFERYMGFLIFFVIFKYYLFIDILGIVKNVGSFGLFIVLLEKDVIEIMGNVMGE